jgi:hypothetical protein
VTQLDLLPECRVPERGTQLYEILMALRNGSRLTVAKAMSDLGVYALSQRVGQLKREYGWPIKVKALKVGPKTYVAEYWMDP